eukprot:TRINITY_DN29056_c0_g1_i1.p1 TRINITY_DN29056_c0_g1~~TRINITY_DN29056_c0_g1_i1.p1  ORF type:complete len:213 (-),score=15.36 TRINITY_DN29056_c0_g1_i1:188-826(-)
MFVCACAATLMPLWPLSLLFVVAYNLSKIPYMWDALRPGGCPYTSPSPAFESTGKVTAGPCFLIAHTLLSCGVNIACLVVAFHFATWDEVRIPIVAMNMINMLLVFPNRNAISTMPQKLATTLNLVAIILIITTSVLFFMNIQYALTCMILVLNGAPVLDLSQISASGCKRRRPTATSVFRQNMICREVLKVADMGSSGCFSFVATMCSAQR